MICLFISFFSQIVMAASVTVCDSGHGCTYTTIATAISGITGGVANTITVKSPYSANEIVTVNKAGASDANRLVITADTGYTPVTKYWYISSAYVTVNGFEIVGSSADHPAVEWEANYVSITNNNIHGTGYQYGFVGQSNGSSMVTYGVLSGNTIHDGVTASPQVVWLMCNYCTIDSNEIYNFTDADGFYFWGHDSVVSNNYIHDLSYNNGANHSDGFQTFGSAGSPYNVAYNWTFEKNLFVSTGADLQPFTIQYDNQSGIHDITIRNNIFMNYGTQANIGVPNTYVYNNTFIDVGVNNEMAINMLVSSGGGEAWDCTGNVVENNLFVSTYNSDPIPETSSSLTTEVTRDYNYAVYTSGGTYHAIGGGGNANPWPQWGETHGINSGQNPLFSNWTIGTVTCGTYTFATHGCTNFSLDLTSSSPPKDVGVNLSGVWSNATDIIGTSRPQGSAWDIGAYEYASGGTYYTVTTQRLMAQSVLLILLSCQGQHSYLRRHRIADIPLQAGRELADVSGTEPVTRLS